MFNSVFEAFKRLAPGPSVPIDERREIVRVACQIPVGCGYRNQQYPVTVVDMGLSGLRLKSPTRFPRGKLVTLSHAGGGPVLCMVVWVRSRGKNEGFELGLRFHDTIDNLRNSWVQNELTRLGFIPGRIQERRKHIRVDADVRAVIANRSGELLVEGRLRNVGISGAMIQTKVEVDVGTSIRLQADPLASVEGLDILSEVRSCRPHHDGDDFLHGLRFVEVADEGHLKRYLYTLLRNQ